MVLFDRLVLFLHRLLQFALCGETLLLLVLFLVCGLVFIVLDLHFNYLCAKVHTTQVPDDECRLLNIREVLFNLIVYSQLFFI